MNMIHQAQVYTMQMVIMLQLIKIAEEKLIVYMNKNNVILYIGILIFCFFFFMQKTAYEFSECDWSSDVLITRRFFFFKQKTAYEISECDWSSDVCSSD